MFEEEGGVRNVQKGERGGGQLGGGMKPIHPKGTSTKFHPDI